MRRRLGKYALRALLVLAPLELAASLAVHGPAKRYFYEPPDPQGYEAYLAKRDPLLGWPAPDTLGGRDLDERGARRVTGGPAEPACGAVFGDSFTHGDGVAAEETWAHGLGVRLGCRVANYGVWGFGTDQALLRFQHRFEEPADFVVLAHFPADIRRNVNRYRGFIYSGTFAFKPRFRLDGDGGLALVPIPEIPPEEIARFGTRGEPLPHEWFWPGGPAGTIAAGFPRMAAVARLPFHDLLRAELAGIEPWAPFYRPDHPSGALPLTVAIFERFVGDAGARGHAAIVMVIPSQWELRVAQAGEALPFAPLLEALDARGFARPGLTEGLLAELDGADPCALFLSCEGGHMNAAGHDAIARVLFRWLSAREALRTRDSSRGGASRAPLGHPYPAMVP